MAPNNIVGKTAEELDAEAYDLKSRANALHAAAARLRAKKATPLGDWVRVDALPIPKSTALAACRSGELRAIKKGRSWLTTRGDADAFLAKAPAAPASNDADDDVRRSLGLGRRSA